MSGPLTDEDELEEERQKRAAARRLHRERLRAVLATPAGRAFIWWLIDDLTGVHGGSFTGDALTSAYQEGRRSIGQEVLVEVQQASRQLYLTMIWERMESLPEPVAEPDAASGD